MSRKDELMEIFDGSSDEVKGIVTPLFDEIEFIESQLVELRTKPLIKYHPKNPNIQKVTPAGKLYKELLSQEKDLIRMLCSLVNKTNTEGTESPLRAYLKSLEISK